MYTMQTTDIKDVVLEGLPDHKKKLVDEYTDFFLEKALYSTKLTDSIIRDIVGYETRPKTKIGSRLFVIECLKAASIKDHEDTFLWLDEISQNKSSVEGLSVGKATIVIGQQPAADSLMSMICCDSQITDMSIGDLHIGGTRPVEEDRTYPNPTVEVNAPNPTVEVNAPIKNAKITSMTIKYARVG